MRRADWRQTLDDKRTRTSSEQSSRSHAGFLDHQDRGHDAGRDRRRYRDDDVELGYLVGTALFLSLLLVLVILQVAAKRFYPWLYWATIVASTTAGTTMADFADRSLGIGYAGGSSLLFVCLMATLGAWYWSQGSISVATVNTPKVEAFYWVAITFSQTLGTALGDWTADDTGLGYDGGALLFAAGLAVLAAAYFWTNTSRVFLFGAPLS